MSQESFPIEAVETGPAVEGTSAMEETAPPSAEEGSESFVSAVLGDMSDRPIELASKMADALVEHVTPPKEPEASAENAPGAETVPPEGEIKATNEAPPAETAAEADDEAPVTLVDIFAQVMADDAGNSNSETPTPEGLAAESTTLPTVESNNAEAEAENPTETAAAPEAVSNEAPKRGLMGRIGKMLSDRRLNIGPDDGKSAKSDNDSESVDKELLDGDEEDAEEFENEMSPEATEKVAEETPTPDGKCEVSTIESNNAEAATESPTETDAAPEAVSNEPPKRGLMGRLGKMLSDRRLNIGPEDAKSAKSDNDSESVDKELLGGDEEDAEEVEKEMSPEATETVAVEALEAPKRGLMGRIGKMLSDRRLNLGEDDNKAPKESDCESVDEGLEVEDEDDVGNKVDDGVEVKETNSDPKGQPRKWNLPDIRKIVGVVTVPAEGGKSEQDGPETGVDKAAVDEAAVQAADDDKGETMEERATKRRGLMKRIGSYVEEKELLKRLSNRNLMQGTDDATDDDTKTGNAALIDECIQAAKEEELDAADHQDQPPEAGAKTGVLSRIGKIIADRRVNATATSASNPKADENPDVKTDEKNDEEADGETKTTAAAPAVARQGFLKGLRDIVSTRSLERSEPPAEDKDPSEGEMINNGWCEASNVERLDVESTEVKSGRRRGLFARINSFIARDPLFEEEDPIEGEEPVEVPNTVELDELMKSGAVCPATDIASGLTLVNSELEKDLPAQRREYLLTLQCYLLKQQSELAHAEMEAPEKVEDQEGALAA